MLDEKTGMLVEPEPPYRPLGILHPIGPARSHEFSLETLAGKRKQPRRG